MEFLKSHDCVYVSRVAKLRKINLKPFFTVQTDFRNNILNRYFLHNKLKLNLFHLISFYIVCEKKKIQFIPRVKNCNFVHLFHILILIIHSLSYYFCPATISYLYLIYYNAVLYFIVCNIHTCTYM